MILDVSREKTKVSPLPEKNMYYRVFIEGEKQIERGMKPQQET